MIRNLILSAVSAMAFASGCQQKCCLNDPNRRPRPYQPPPPSSPVLIPAPGLPTTPAPPGPTVPSVIPSDPRNYSPPALAPVPSNPSTKPAPDVLYPDPLPGGASSRSSFPADPGFGVSQNPSKPKPTPQVPVVPTKIVCVPGFTKVEEGLASGRKPDLDGFAALKQAGYRTIIFLHASGADLSAVRDVVEKRGLSFLPIETTPERLTEAREAFNNAVSDRTVRPAYVFDDDGVRAGALWYLYFRSRSYGDDAARVMAKPLGMNDRVEEGRTFELAIQRYLETH